MEAVGPIIFLSTDTKKLRNEGFISPYHPRFPDILTNSAHPLVILIFVFNRIDINFMNKSLCTKKILNYSIHSTMQRAQDLANVTAYREWVLFGYLVCPDELRRVTSIDIALV